MKVSTIFFVAGLIMLPVIGLAQISEIPVSSTQQVTTDIQRCGASSYKFFNECDLGLYKNVYAQCFDGFDATLGDATLCQPVAILTNLADVACTNHCPNKDVPPSSDEPPITPVIPETAVPAIAPTPTTTTPGASAPTTAATLSPTKCGVNSSVVSNECGAGVYKNVFAQCYDGFEVILGGISSCKPTDLWNQYAKETCASHCFSRNASEVVSTPSLPQPTESTPVYYYKETTEGGNRSTPLGPSSVPIVKVEWVSVCTTIDTLTQNYNESVLELQKQEALNNKGKIEDITRNIENLKKYTEDVKKICSTDPQNAWQVAAPPKGTGNIPIYTQESKPVSITTKPLEIPKATPVCYIGDDLFQKYNQLIIELQKSESDKARTEEVTKQIIELKQQISVQQNKCVNNSSQPKPTIVSWPAPTIAPQSMPTGAPVVTGNIPVAVLIDRCNEVAQWETKITYYKKLSNLSEDDLRKSGFSREEIEKILQELTLGIEKVRGQCNSRVKTTAVPRITAITGSASIAETVRPIVAESGQEISAYYKAKIEKAVSAKGAEKQIEELKTVRDEIDELISNLIKSRKELEVSELNGLVKEVKVSRGEIKADDISVKTTEKKMIVSVGNRPVSIEPTENQVLIRDKELEVNTNEVTIKENVLSVGGVDVKMSASEVSEKLGLIPTTVELKEENMKAVYNMKINERRKLFGFIPLNVQRAVAADAENGNILSEHLPWYNFLTTK